MTELIGIVIIGRNEGERLVRCLQSVRGQGRVVYVDSGSTDASIDEARRLGAEVVVLDASHPFTAARARNAGFARLRELDPAVRYVQFVDGDCEIRDGWLTAGAGALDADPGAATVCGRLRERHPERSIYNRMCDIGWDYPVGTIESCGGVAMYRADRFTGAGGFNESLIAGEEFDLCSRIRAAGGGQIRRIADEMAWHDVGITRFRQWWKRAARAGFAYAEGWALHPPKVGASYRRNAVRALFWGALLPLSICAFALGGIVWRPLLLVSGAAALLLVAQAARLIVRELRRGRAARDAAGFGAFLFIAKLPEAIGAMNYWIARLRRHRTAFIEYR